MITDEIKVLLVDDEAIIRKGLRKTIEWEKFGMRVVADEPNGLKGWESFLELQPDVIITDIVMPEMNGIEFAAKVKAHMPETKILLLSCHQDFEYAQMGLKIGASGYLLKTSYNDDELEEFLLKFQDEIRRAERRKESKVETEGLGKLFMEWFYRLNDRFPSELDSLRQREGSWMQEQGRVYLLFGCSAELKKEWTEQAVGANVHSVWVGAGDDALFLLCPDHCAHGLDLRLTELKAKGMEIRWLKSESVVAGDGWPKAMLKLYEHLQLERSYRLQIGDWPYKITEAVQYMVRHIETPLSVTEVAEQAGLSRSHFSTLFKKVVGESFISFLYRIKLKVVYDLLTNTSLTVQDISDRVGMPDAKYFSKWFKRCTGLTPSQYRTDKNST